ncbi:Calx-beta domain-containing protein [Microvirga calopogonii]|uniref:Calx-beta domain-containing protein n=1 Tax=Microvirga calopogonii TaxID=2078013 RepID=UPI0013B4768E|nr:Calx-beta domain-containing protein [Microvirga calopogonii]
MDVANGVDGNNGDRFKIIKATIADPGGRWAVGDWIVVIDQAVDSVTGASKFDYEDVENPLGTGMQFRGTGGTHTWNINYSTSLTDVNEAPKNVVHNGAPVTSGQQGVVVGALSAYDEDDAYWTNDAAVITYAVDAGLNSNLFEIVAGAGGPTLKVKDGQALTYAGAPKTDATGHYYEVNIRVTDGGGYVGGAQNPTASPAQSRVETVKVYVAQGNQPPSPPSYTGTPTVAENASSTTVGTIVTVGGSTDPEGQAVTYALSSTAGANPGNRFVVAADGKITLATGMTLDYEAADLQTDANGKYYVVKVVASDGPNVSTDKDVKIYVTNVNEAPGTATYTSNGAINETAANNTPVGTLAATDPDGTTPTFKFVNAQAGSNGLISSDGAFKIVGGQIQVNDATQIQVTTGSSRTFSYQVVATDGALDSATATTVGITVNNVNQAPTDPTAAATINERSGNGTTVLAMDDFDDNGEAISYTFAVAQDAAHKISLDGKFRIEGNKIVVNGTLSEVAQDTTLPNYAIVADDNSGAPNGTVTGNVSITVKNVPLLSIAAVTTGPVTEGDAGTVDYVFRVTRDSTGSGSSVKWTVSGTGINADDFEVLSDTITFSPTDTFKDIVLKVKADRVAELNENFTVTLSDLQGADINPGQGSATGSITDDDNAPSFLIRTGEDSHSGNVGTAIANVLAGVDIEDLDGDELTLTVSFQNVRGALTGMVTGGGVTVTDNGGLAALASTH